MIFKDLSVALDGPGLEDVLRQSLALNASESIPPYTILRRSIDARKKDRVRIVFTVRVGPESDETPFPPGEFPRKLIGRHPFIVGSGPAGLFTALSLVEKGYEPLIIERGTPLARRIVDVARLQRSGTLEPESNILFGEGGAGTYSDGKLTHRSKHRLVHKVFADLVSAGAPAEILYEQKPHLGTDRLRAIVTRLRKKIEDGGGRFRFGSRLTDIEITDGAVRAVRVGDDRYETDALFLATGHSARDTYRMLADRGVALASKAFAVGVRVEHDQTFIDNAQFGKFAGHPDLGPADYRLTWNDPETGRGVYSFCNCPGGVIVPAVHEPETVNTNGMSRYARDSGLSNSALVVTVPVDDYSADSPLDGLFFQDRIERHAYRIAGGGYVAPAQRTLDFLRGRTSASVDSSSYRPGIAPGNLHQILPEEVSIGLARAIPVFGRKIRGFEQSILVGPETRTSSPVRVVRDPDTMESVNVRGLFPIGEGSGYSGGIVSSAVDALRAVERIEAISG